MFSLFESICPPESFILILPIKEIMVKVDSSSHAMVVVTACIVLPILSSVFMVLRIWTRHFVSHSLGWDDC